MEGGPNSFVMRGKCFSLLLNFLLYIRGENRRRRAWRNRTGNGLGWHFFFFFKDSKIRSNVIIIMIKWRERGDTVAMRVLFRPPPLFQVLTWLWRCTIFFLSYIIISLSLPSFEEQPLLPTGVPLFFCQGPGRRQRPHARLITVKCCVTNIYVYVYKHTGNRKREIQDNFFFSSDDNDDWRCERPPWWWARVS